MSKSKIFIWISISFTVGILAASVFNLPRQAVYIFLGSAAAAFALSFISQQKKSALAALFLFCGALGVLRLQISVVPNQYQDLLDSKQQLQGYIAEDVQIKNNLQTLTFHPNGFSQNILITTTLEQKFFYGDQIVANGKLEAAKNFGDFDYQKYLERYNIYAVMGYPQTLILKSHRLNPVKEFLLRLKDGFIQRINPLLHEPQASLLVAILTGARGNLPKILLDQMSETGTSHIISVDGFKTMIIIGLIYSLAFYIGRKWAFWLATFSLIGFLVITGAPASAVRAAVMGFLLILSFNIGRQYAVVPALFFAALIMLVANPKILFWDSGFQLSFAAVLGIIYFLPVFNQLSQKLPEIFGIKKLILITLAATIATLPLVMLNFNVFSLSAVFTNILVMPVLALAMLFGFLSVIPFIGPGFAFVANWFLIYIIKVVSLFANLPFSYFNVQISALEFWLYNCLIFVLYFILRFLQKRQILAVEQSARLW